MLTAYTVRSAQFAEIERGQGNHPGLFLFQPDESWDDLGPKELVGVRQDFLGGVGLLDLLGPGIPGEVVAVQGSH